MLRLLAVLLLCSCGGGSDEPAENHGYGWGYDVQTVGGTRVRFVVPITVADPLSALSHEEIGRMIDQEFQAAVACTGLPAAVPPYVVIVAQSAIGGEGQGGYYYSAPPLIAVAFILMLRHEAIHYLLDLSTGDLDAAHNSPLFAKCS